MNLLAQRELPLPNYPSDVNFAFEGRQVGDIISALLPYVFVLAGLLLLGLIILGGFQYLTSRGDPKAVESARGRLTGAILGFVIIFTSYWVVQIIEIIFEILVFYFFFNDFETANFCTYGQVDYAR